MPRMMLPAASRGKLKRPERHALVELDVAADVAGLADDDAGAVVDEEAGPDAGAGWMSMPVLEWAYSVIIRGMSGTPSSSSSWAMR